ncbi:monooxygenase [Frondihabitans sucicola]|uniref:Monooxygenase n=1 Tax=Frondihabitans sucicola TaxID=1268041 RepID=A0ABN6XXV3_9MICO|nr:monooxygenase [Frondihabitans sucicola]
MSGSPAPVEVDTLIVGAGFAGLGLAIRLQRERRGSYLVLERANDVGGTWRDNVYPGVACDIPSHLYSFSFRPNPDWSQFYSPGGEILRYLQDAARDEGILPRLRFGAELTEARWDADGECWEVSTTAGAFRGRTLVVATGRLSEKRVPDIEGLGTFGGGVLHSSEWPDELELAGRRVGLVGTGASAVQLLPALAERAAGVVVFQRSAPYVVPRRNTMFSSADRAALAADPEAAQALRRTLFWEAEAGFTARIRATSPLSRLGATAADHLRAQVPDARLREALTPDYEIGCKRVLLSDDYYPSLSRPGVELEPSAVVRVDRSGVIAASGHRHELDLLILATGFTSTEPPIAGRVRGRDELLLADAWAGGMVAYNSTAVAGFPNLFVIDGPNASLGHNSAVHMIETQIGFVLEALDHLSATGASTLEPTRTAQDAYVRELDRRAATTVWTSGGCRSWYVDERSGRLTLLWPDTASAFREEAGRFEPGDFVRRLAGGGVAG